MTDLFIGGLHNEIKNHRRTWHYSWLWCAGIQG